MKTTIEVSDALLNRAKRVALERNTTLRALIEEALERAIGSPAARAVPLETVTYGDPREPLPAFDSASVANPDTDDPAYVAKRLGMER